jgi:hypothetical protein
LYENSAAHRVAPRKGKEAATDHRQTIDDPRREYGELPDVS